MGYGWGPAAIYGTGSEAPQGAMRGAGPQHLGLERCVLAGHGALVESRGGSRRRWRPRGHAVGKARRRVDGGDEGVAGAARGGAVADDAAGVRDVGEAGLRGHLAGTVGVAGGGAVADLAAAAAPLRRRERLLGLSAFVKALREGRQVLLVRKGGISEETRDRAIGNTAPLGVVTFNVIVGVPAGA